MSERIATMPWGYVETFGDNEIAIVSTKADPPKVRLASTQVESNLGVVSFDIRRADGNLEAYAEITGRLTADKQEGALYIALRPRGEQSCREVLYLDPGVLLSHVPVQAPNVGGNAAPNEMRHLDGIHWFVMQNDGNLVVYKNRVPFDYRTGDALFDTQALLARLAALEAR